MHNFVIRIFYLEFVHVNCRSKKTWKSICRFQVFPWKNFTNLQFFELDDDVIQDEIQKPIDQTTCMVSSYI